MNIKNVSRRDFLKVTGFGLGGATLAACAPAAATSAAAPTEAATAAAATPTPTPTVEPTTPAAIATGGAPVTLKGASINFLGYAMFVPKMNEIFQSFAIDWATQNGVKFNLEMATTSDVAARVATAIETGQGPTIVQYASPPANIVDGLTDITELADKLAAQQGGWYPAAPAVATVDQKWYAIPLGSHTPVYAWRPDWFTEAGIEKFPDTWNEFYEAGKVMKKAGHPFGFVLGGSGTPFDGLAHAMVLLWSYGAKEFEPDGTLVLDSPETIAALEYAIKLHQDANDPGATAYNDATNNQAFIAEQLSATMNVNTIYLPALTNAPKVAAAMKHALPPQGPAGRFTYQGYPYISILNHTEGMDRDAALAFLGDFFAVGQYAQYIKEGRGYLIPLAPTYESLPIWDIDPKLAIMREAGRLSRWGGFENPSPTKLSAAMVSQFTVAKMFHNAATNGNAREALDGTLREIEDLQAQVGG